MANGQFLPSDICNCQLTEKQTRTLDVEWQMDSSFLPSQFLPFTRRDESLLYPSTYFSCFSLKHPLEAENISPTAFFSTVAGHLSTEMTKQFSLEFHFKL
uniref:Uncharacterized protein n=1 Tax=Populus davidiana TaxID=266767 RepID=A0A6M2EJ43_9ROSI